MDYVIIVAGGKGLRMGGEIPKQFLPIGGKPVLMRTIERFREYSADLQIILVLPEAQQDYWKELCKEYDFEVGYLLANGGQTRFHSVQNGLALVPDDAEGVIGVHDGVRPFPSIEVIRNCYETARTTKAVIPVIPVVETLRKIFSNGQNGLTRTIYSEAKESETVREVRGHNFSNGQNGLTQTIYSEAKESETVREVRGNNFSNGQNGLTQTIYSEAKESETVREVRGKKESETVPRDEYRLVQTPQTFDIQLLKAANRQPYNDGFTDDASVVESYGHPITLVDGNRENIKITTPYDLVVAEAILHSPLSIIH
jgi:2-C-methyl-D-erythritol 4-phosphate cytidylyltransferase